MTLLQNVLTVAGSVLPVLVAFLTCLIKFIKNEKAKKALQQTLELAQQLQPLIVQAEEFAQYSGAEKKEYVLTRVNRYALDKGLKFDSVQVGQLIDALVDTTKKVNVKRGVL